jgi:hypothetical protein
MRVRHFAVPAFLTLVLSSTLWAPLAVAGIPSPANSTAPNCLDLCPAGDMPYTVVVRDITNAPIANSTVVIDFCQCPGVHLCPAMPGDTYTIVGGCQVTAVTNAAGTVVFPIRGGGLCTSGARVFADGILLAQGLFVRSPDQDGDLIVAAPDLSIFATKFGGADPTADFDCDGDVDLADQTTFSAHFGHFCGGVVPTRPSTWGHVKQIYR